MEYSEIKFVSNLDDFGQNLDDFGQNLDDFGQENLLRYTNLSNTAISSPIKINTIIQ